MKNIFLFITLINVFTFSFNETKTNDLGEFNYNVQLNEDFFENINTLADDFIQNPIQLPNVCFDSKPIIEYGSMELTQSFDLKCKGNWLHQGNGCFMCHENTSGPFHCCDGELKDCN
jgi:hypothetical protein